MPAFLTDVAAIVGAGHLLTQAHDTAPFTLDYRRRYQGQPLAVALPGNTDEVAALLRLCQQHRVAVVPQGGNTSTCGAATPDRSGRQLVIAMQRLNRLRAIDTANDSMTVEAGMTLAAVQQAAAEAGR
ncbi:MAG: FAD-binding oxidoreductase, partial [Aquitalea sp.]|nr:FAD-binding oxidoreductase [Aquitalea sp.]